jgi:hypothetical protein
VKLKNEEAGLVILGLSYANLSIKSKTDGLYLVKGICEKADKGNPEIETIITKLNTSEVWLKVKVDKGAKCTFSYSLDGITYTEAIQNFQAFPGKWVGAKIGLFSIGNTKINDTGYADFDWFRINK